MADIAAVTQIEITAKDSTQSTFGTIKGGLNGLGNAVSGLQGQLVALGGLLGIGTFARMVKDTIDAADKLNDLAKKTGIAVETLGGFSYVAEQTGTNLESIAKGASRLASQMADAAGGNIAAASTFRALGVAVKDSGGNLRAMDDVLLDVADRFESYEDGAGKAALANQLFGERLGAQLIPFLDEGGTKIRELITEYERWGGVTADTAARADAFNDTIAKLQLMFSAVTREVASALLPTLQTLANMWVENKEKAGGFRVVAEGVTVIFKGLSLALVSAVEGLKIVGTALGGIFAAIAQAIQGKFGQAWRTMKEVGGDAIKSTTDAIDRLQVVWNASTATVATATETNLGKRTRAPIVAVKEEVEKLSKKFGEGIGALKAYFDEVGKIYAGTERMLKGIQQINEEEAKHRNAVSDMVREMEFEVAALTMTNQEREVSIALRKLEQEQIYLTTEELDRYTARIRSAAAQKEQLQGQIDLWKSIESAAEDAFVNIFQAGKNAFDRLKDALKQGLMALLYQLTVKPFIIQLAATMSGNGSVATALGAASGGGGSLGSLLGGLGNLGSGALSSDFTAALAGDAFLPGALPTGGPGLGSMLGSALSPLLSALPMIAAVAGIGLLIKNLLDGKKGGPKSGGYAFSGEIAGWDRATHFTPNQDDSAMKAVTDTLLASYQQTLAALGGKGSGGFDFGYDTDPQGGANNRLGVRAMVNGQQVYNYWSGDNALGRDQAALQAAIELETKRALLAALQASELPEDIGLMLNSLTAAGATSAEIDRILALAAAVKQIKEQAASLGTLGDDLEKAASRTTLDACRLQGEALDKLKENYAGTASQTDELIASSQAYYQSLVAVVAQIRQVKQQVEAMFGETRQSIYLSGRDDKFLYEFYQKEVDKLYGALGSTTDPAKLAEISAQINDYISRAFGLLSPEQQSAARDAYIDSIDKITATVNARLEAIERNVTSAGKTELQEAAALIVQAATKQLDAASKTETAAEAASRAASTQLTAATTQLTAANTPLTITVDLVTAGGVNG